MPNEPDHGRADALVSRIEAVVIGCERARVGDPTAIVERRPAAGHAYLLLKPGCCSIVTA